MACAETDYPPSLRLAAVNPSGLNHDSNLFHSMQCDYHYPLYDFDPDMDVNWSPISMDPSEANPSPTFQSLHPLDAMDFSFVGNGVDKSDIDPNLLSGTKSFSRPETPQNINSFVGTKQLSAAEPSEPVASLKSRGVNPSRRLSPRANEDDKPNVASLTKPRRRQRRKKGSLTAAEVQEKRDRLLQRNRVAATKCRLNRKAEQNKLQESARKLDGEKQALTALANSLKEEALSLKSQMLQHAGCDCERINAYLNKEADSLAYGKGSSIPNRPSSIKSERIVSPATDFLDFVGDKAEDERYEEEGMVQEDDEHMPD